MCYNSAKELQSAYHMHTHSTAKAVHTLTHMRALHRSHCQLGGQFSFTIVVLISLTREQVSE